MRYLLDFRDMKNGEFISNKSLQELNDRNINNRLSELKTELNSYTKREIELFENLLSKMAEISCVKNAIDMKVTMNTIIDKRYKDKIYLQSRGAVTTSKKNRVWANHYHGPESKYVNGRKNEKVIKEGRTIVVNKIISELKEINGL